MNTVRQNAVGTEIHQTTKIFNRPLDPVDICADKISAILTRIANINFLERQSIKLTPPHIIQKNEKNNIDQANAIEIENTYALWDEITSAISVDSTGALAEDYSKASFILQQSYLAHFQNNFPAFKLHALTTYCENTNSGTDEGCLLIHLIHYMYLSCQVGVKP